MLHNIAPTVAHFIRTAVVDPHQCIPMNDLFTGPLGDTFNLLIGGIGGVTIKWVVTIALLVILIRTLINVIRSRRANEDMSSIAVVIIVVVAIILAIIIVRTIFAALNGGC